MTVKWLTHEEQAKVRAKQEGDREDSPDQPRGYCPDAACGVETVLFDSHADAGMAPSNG